MNTDIKKLFLNILSLLFLFLSWQIVSILIFSVRGIHFPGPMDVVSRLIDLCRGNLLYDHSIFFHLKKSLCRWTGGYAIALLGIPIGAVFGASPALHRLCMPTIYAPHMIPGLALLPVAMLLFGIGTASTMFMITLMALPPIVINTAGGIRKIPAGYIASARMMEARFYHIWFHILLPGALPDIVNGMRIGMGSAWRVLVAAEMIVGMDAGLGYAIIQSRWSMDYESAFVSILIIVCIGLTIEFILFRRLENLMTRKMGVRFV